MDGSSRLNAAVNSSAISYNAHDGNSCCDRIRYLISKKEKEIKKNQRNKKESKKKKEKNKKKQKKIRKRRKKRRKKQKQKQITYTFAAPNANALSMTLVIGSIQVDCKLSRHFCIGRFQ